ncbi:MAG TPA: ATPase, partial [Candidatus Cloacimonadota bacterium]|nr:ATPase [Candidatus Cloacimonadota bacterium]
NIHFQFQDCPPGTSCSMINATKDADFVILVTEPTPFGLYDLSLAVETMQQLGKPMGVVINRFGIGNNEVFEYCSRQNLPILTVVNNDREIAELYTRGELIYPQHPQFCQGMDEILMKLNRIREGK